ncbi:type I restriction endonuclease [Bhargavaea beijingensis]|uniref:type I restriction endonuclease n=1 Tax=Bhargavaea beijingensis TaxID=426756 RepID=UPI0022257BE8|nr:type I restriction endonuclease [Bhargavaea beijingensis]MCW1929291.1 type I restriction endonuclease [Bhargavaea beijingensis]
MEKFTERLRSLSKRVKGMQSSIMTEEATKTSVIMPFFQIMGYDIFNPEEFVPEFTADVGIKKGEKVDYAIMHDGKPVILIEAKGINDVLLKHDSQLFRYFGTTTAKFAILTNGIIYRFFTDLEQSNKMDSEPFFEFNLFDMKEAALQELYKFHKESFDLDKIFSTASDLKYLNKTKSFLDQMWNNPDEAFMTFVIGHIYEGKKTKAVLDRFDPIIKKSMKQFINEMVNEKLNAALKSTSGEETQIEKEAEQKAEIVEEPENLIVTTEEEIEGYSIVKVLLHDDMDVGRIFYRDNLSYFNILLDDNIRKWIMRLGLNGQNKYIQFNDGDRTTVSIEKVTDIIKYKDKILEVTQRFMGSEKNLQT